MLWYLIKANNNLWTTERIETQRSSIEEYKTTLEKRNTSTCKYITVCNPLGGTDNLRRIVEFKLNQNKQFKQKVVKSKVPLKPNAI
jgi:hypothetical protein